MMSIFTKLTKMSINLTLLLRVMQTAFALVVLALSSYGSALSDTKTPVIHWYDSTTAISPPSEFIFLLFASLWSLLSCAAIELAPRFLPRAPKPYVGLPLEAGSALFYLAGWVALCAFFGRLLFCRGVPCRAAQADAAFAAFSFALWAASAASSATELVRRRRLGGGGGGGPVGAGIGGGGVAVTGGTKEAAV